LVKNVAHPEGNITGLATNSNEVVGKWVELLKETVPTISRLAALADLSGPGSGPGTRAVLTEAERAAQSLRLEFRAYDLNDLGRLPALLSMATAEGADGLVLVSGGAIGGGVSPQIGAEVLKSRLPAVAERQPFAVNGGLLAHGPNARALVRR